MSPFSFQRLSLLLLVLLLPAGSLWSQGKPTAKAELRPAERQAGEFAIYQIVVQGFSGTVEPPLVTSPGLKFKYREMQVQFVSVSGRRSLSAVFSYEVVGMVPGTYEIPGPEIETQQGKVTANATRLKVLPANGGSRARSAFEPYLQLELGKTEMYLGELVPVEVVLVSNFRTKIDDPDLPGLESDGFAFRRFPGKFESGSVEVDGEEYRTWTFRSRFSALSAGPSNVGPAKMGITLLLPMRRSGSLLPGGDRFERRAFSLESPLVPVTVKKLPEEGKPPGFSGPVGVFRLASRVSASQSVKVGDPVNVLLEVEGIGNFGAVDCPRISDGSKWRLYDPQIYEEADRHSLGKNRVAFSQVVVPTEVTTELPAFEFQFFDPDRREYRTVSTDPVPLEVLPGTDVVRAIPVSEESGEGAEPLVGRGGAEAPAELKDVLHVLASSNWGRHSVAGPMGRHPLFLFSLFLGIAALILASGAPLAGRWFRGEKRVTGESGAGLEEALDNPSLGTVEFCGVARRVLERAEPGEEREELERAVAEIDGRCRFGGGREVLQLEERERLVRELKGLL